MRWWVFAVALGTATLGCEAEPEQAPVVNLPTTVVTPSSHEHPVAEDDDSPRLPLGAGAVDCSAGSIDPTARIEEAMAIAERGRVADAIVSMEALAGGHPSSAAARVRLGELLSRRAEDAVTARIWFRRALDLHDRGCSLDERNHWLALEGIATTHLREGDYAAAIPLLRSELILWPTMSGTRYNLACALCQTGDLDGCETELRAVLAPDAPPVPDAFRDQARSRERYLELAQIDSDLDPLREDGARFAAVISR